MRRSLVLTNDGARHSFRASLPSYLPSRWPDRDYDGGADTTHPAAMKPVSDIRGFVNVYLAALAAALVFLI